MRTIQGSIVLPPDAPKGRYGRLLVEVRDVSRLDAPSTVVAHTELDNVAIEPDGQVPFELEVPEVEAVRSLSLRVHASHDGSQRIKSGDLLTTSSYPIPTSGTQAPMTVAVKVV
jgi:putative lipoprotein